MCSGGGRTEDARLIAPGLNRPSSRPKLPGPEQTTVLQTQCCGDVAPSRYVGIYNA